MIIEFHPSCKCKKWKQHNLIIYFVASWDEYDDDDDEEEEEEEEEGCGCVNSDTCLVFVLCFRSSSSSSSSSIIIIIIITRSIVVVLLLLLLFLLTTSCCWCNGMLFDRAYEFIYQFKSKRTWITKKVWNTRTEQRLFA